MLPIPLRDHNPSRTTPWFTWGIILACILAFLAQITQPESVQLEWMETYALVPARLSRMVRGGGLDTGVLATLFASMFMHGGLAHIAGNLWFMRIFGDNVEDNFGHARYVGFYFVCGIAAALTQWLADPWSKVPMVGASGAIAGVLAAYLVLYPHAKVTSLWWLFVFVTTLELPAWVLITAWFVLQFFPAVLSYGTHVMGGVAYWAHVGGFVAGLAGAFLLRRPVMVAARVSGGGWRRGGGGNGPFGRPPPRG